MKTQIGPQIIAGNDVSNEASGDHGHEVRG